MGRCSLIAGLVVGLGVGVALGQAAPAGRDWEGLVQQLGSEEFGVRRGAQDELEKVRGGDLEGVRAVIGRVEDPEVRAALTKRLRELEAMRAMETRRVTVRLKDVPLERAVEEINREAGAEVLERVVGIDKRVTMQREGSLLWEVLEEVQGKTGVGIGARANGQLTLHMGVSDGPFKAVGDFGFRIKARATKTISGEVHVEINAVAVADPRIAVVGYVPTLEVERVVNGEGKRVNFEPVNIGSAKMRRVELPGIPLIGGYVSQTVIEKKIGLIKGSFQVAVAVEREVLTVEGIDKEAGKRLKTSWGEVEFGKVVWEGGKLTVSTKVQRNGAVRPVGERGDLEEGERIVPVISYLDGKNRCLLTHAASSIVLTTQSIQPEGGVRAEVIWPKRIQEVCVPVEFRDLEIK